MRCRDKVTHSENVIIKVTNNFTASFKYISINKHISSYNCYNYTDYQAIVH